MASALNPLNLVKNFARFGISAEIRSSVELPVSWCSLLIIVKTATQNYIEGISSIPSHVKIKNLKLILSSLCLVFVVIKKLGFTFLQKRRSYFLLKI